nr:hypothetical protein [Collimonas silvisoli]
MRGFVGIDLNVSCYQELVPSSQNPVSGPGQEHCSIVLPVRVCQPGAGWTAFYIARHPSCVQSVGKWKINGNFAAKTWLFDALYRNLGDRRSWMRQKSSTRRIGQLISASLTKW